MARMLPPTVPPDVQSNAEKVLFDRMAAELSDEWIVLHSLGLTIHDRKPWAEIDFVLIGPPGVFCLEVKGGLISRREGIWYTTPLRGPDSGRRHRLSESPFEQVGSAAARLHRFLEGRVPEVAKAIVGYAVATPDSEWTVTGPDVDRALVYDHKDSMAPFEQFLARIASKWDERIGRGWKRELDLLGRAGKRRVLDAIRGDFALVPSLRATAEAAGRELVRLTDEQADLFARLAGNSRVIARGGAGTGKTMIAVEEARRLAAGGERVLLTCFSRNLARHLANRVGETERLTIRTLHSLMVETVERAGLSHRLPDAEGTDLLQNFYPDLCLEILLDEPGRRFDAVVVDEGQDLLLEPYVDVIEALLEGGLSHGTWRWFLDPNQNIFSSTAPQGLGRLLATGPVDWPLTVNCRNTAPIATQVSLLTGAHHNAVLSTDGPDVEYEWWESQDDQRRKVSKRLTRLVHEGFSEDRIVVLSPYRIENSCVAQGLTGGRAALTDVSRGGIDVAARGVRFSTIASFKGLESDVVLLVDVEDLSDPHAQSLVYVGTSRARLLLVLFLDQGLSERVGILAHDFGQQLSSPAARTDA